MNSKSRGDLPLVSIIMAAKDTAPYLHECITSIIAQTYPHWELIAVNDHSSDETPHILEAFAQKDARIRVYHSMQRDLIPTLKYGYSFATGELINRMDSDDIMPAYKLLVLVEAWQKWGKGTVVAGGAAHFVDEGQVGEGFLRYDRWLNEIATDDNHYQEIYKECSIPSQCWLIHRDDFDAVGAFDPKVYPEDYDLCFRFYKHQLKVVGLSKVLNHWRDRPDRISRTLEVYKDNRYFDLKLHYFLELDRDPSRPLVLWGAGTNGKNMAKLLQEKGQPFHWVCNNQKKIGLEVYGVEMRQVSFIEELEKPQIMIVVASPEGKKQIRKRLTGYEKQAITDFWFFL
ncbi:glycosyltransferase family 2 protein [Roseivirga echinicomitans]